MTGAEKGVRTHITKIAKAHYRKTLGWLDGSTRPRPLKLEKSDFHMSHGCAGVLTEILFLFSKLYQVSFLTKPNDVVFVPRP